MTSVRPGLVRMALAVLALLALLSPPLAQANPGSLVDAAWLKDALAGKDVLVLDAQPAKLHDAARGPNETATIHLKNRPETLPVSRAYLHLFRQM